MSTRQFSSFSYAFVAWKPGGESEEKIVLKTANAESFFCGFIALKTKTLRRFYRELWRGFAVVFMVHKTLFTANILLLCLAEKDSSSKRVFEALRNRTRAHFREKVYTEDAIGVPKTEFEPLTDSPWKSRLSGTNL